MVEIFFPTTKEINIWIFTRKIYLRTRRRLASASHIKYIGAQMEVRKKQKISGGIRAAQIDKFVDFIQKTQCQGRQKFEFVDKSTKPYIIFLSKSTKKLYRVLSIFRQQDYLRKFKYE